MKSQDINKKIESLVHWKKQIENKIADLQRELAIIEVETPQWENTIEYQIEPETEVLTGVKFYEPYPESEQLKNARKLAYKNMLKFTKI